MYFQKYFFLIKTGRDYIVWAFTHGLCKCSGIYKIFQSGAVGKVELNTHGNLKRCEARGYSEKGPELLCQSKGK